MKPGKLVLTRPTLQAADASFADASFAQERLWFLEQLNGKTPVYNMPAVYRFRASINPKIMQRVLSEIVGRHETLRTTFRSVDGRPVQIIHKAGPFDLQVVELESLSPSERELKFANLVDSNAAEPFDLVRGPLFRAKLVNLSRDHSAILLCMHHIVSDGWSMDVLQQEIGKLYSAFATHGKNLLPELPIQYADFAAWQRDQLQGERLSTMLKFWRQHLEGAAPVLDWPTDRPRPAAQSFVGGIEPFIIESNYVASLQAIAQVSQTTPFVVWFSAFQAFVYRYTGQSDFVLGVPVANRPRPELEPLIGLFVNTLAVRCRPDDIPFDEFVSRNREVMLEVLAHQEVAFELVVQDLRPARMLSVSPLFQTLFVFQTSGVLGRTQQADPPPESDLPEIPGQLGNGTAKFDLTCTLVEQDGRLYGTLEYATDLFNPATIRAMAGHFVQLIKGLAQVRNRPIGEISLVSEDDLARLLEMSKGPVTPWPQNQGLHELVAALAQKNPSATAIVTLNERVTYGELDEVSERVAAELRRHDVQSGDRVGVCLGRQPNLVSALLGVLKAGATYVPLDPRYPSARSAFILDDCRASAILTSQEFRGGLPSSFGGAILNIEELGQLSTGVPPFRPVGDDLAYIIYTSGSTGRPKGVKISHAAAVSFVSWVREEYSDEELSAVLAGTSVCFDLSVFELFGTLASRGTVVLVSDAMDIESVPADVSITLLNTVPSVAAELLRLKLIPDSVQTINLAGEPLTNALAQSLYENTKANRVVNLYGPTEDTTYSTIAHVERGANRVVPIGRPLSNRRAYVLDNRGCPVPLGVVGEIFLAGSGVAVGYDQRLELTAERFVADTFHPSGGRMFRTGDFGRYRSDGQLEYLGRKDSQVKLRGYRIELGEIRESILAQPGLADCYVSIRRSENSWPLLAAHVVFGNPGATVESLIESLSRLMPEYMVPSAWSVVESLPLTLNGKVDVRNLPDPVHWVASRYADNNVRELTTTEQKLAAIWTELLLVTDVRPSQSFFELGGHSLLVAQMVSRVRERFEVELQLRDVFESSTLDVLARRIDELIAVNAPIDDPIPTISRAAALPLSFAQERLWFLDQFIQAREMYVIPWVQRLEGEFAPAAFDRAIQQVIRRHESLRTRFVQVAGVPQQKVDSSMSLNLTLHDGRRLSASAFARAVDQLVAENATTAFDLETGPLIRCAIVCARDHSLLLFAMHHIIADGESMSVLFRELSAFYEAEVTGQSAELPYLPIQYADFAVWQRDRLQEKNVGPLLEFWRKQLHGAPSLVTFPPDQPRPRAQTYPGAITQFEIPRSVVRQLSDCAQEEKSSMFMILLAAFKLVLRGFASTDDVVVGAPVSGRQRRELESLIGFFVNSIVLRTQIGGSESFRQLLRRVRRTVLDALEHQELPFERVVEELRPARALNHSPLFQVMFGLQRVDSLTPDTESSINSEGAEIPLVGSGTSKFDVTVALTESRSEVTGAVEYNTDLYNASTMERIVESYLSILKQVADDSDCLLSTYQLLPLADQYLLASFRDTAAPFPQDHCFHELFEQQVERTPMAVAVVGSDTALTYQQLSERSNDIAAHLFAAGVDIEERVGLLSNRTADAIAAVLGIMKAGAAFVPLDPAAPQARRDFVVTEAGVRFVVTQRDFAGNLPDRVSGIFLEDVTTGNPAQNRTSPAGLAYVIFTSGSTGQPKGVCVEHRSAVSLTWAMQNRIYDAYRDEFPIRASLFAPFFFDGMIERLGLLLSGHELHVIPEHIRQDPVSAVRYCSRNRLKSLDFTPSHLGLMLAEGLLSMPDYQPQVVSVGGEEISPAQWRELASLDIDFFNVYGPTECTVNTTAGKISDPSRQPNIGRPLLNTQVFILSDDLSETPVGVAGELWVGGPGVARGYLNRPELTAERFLSVLIRGVEQRLYRTGDKGRWLPTGEIEYLGRLDGQIKIRGYRIEPGEIASVLQAQPGVANAVVIAREDVPGDKRLVAYVVPVADATPSVSDLRAAARTVLPPYMLPSAIILIPEVPLSPSGKVDTTALPMPDRTRPDLGKVMAPPQTPLQEDLHAIWAEVLGLERVGIHDDFFELGGYSLLVVQVLARMRSRLNVDLPPRALFEFPTIAELAGHIEGIEWETRGITAETDAVAQRFDSLSDEELDALLGGEAAEKREV